MNNLFDEIAAYHFSNLDYTDKYARLHSLLDRLCKQLTADEPTDFSNLFARLYFLCDKRKIKSQAIEVFRIHARQTLQQHAFTLTHEDYLYDVKALCETVSQLLHEPVPTRLTDALPAHWRPLPQTSFHGEWRKRVRMLVDRWEEDIIYGIDEESPGSEPLQVVCPEEFASGLETLYRGAQLNLLSVSADEAGLLRPELIVFEPDYLIDISSLAACYQNYGDTPLNYLYSKFRPQESTHYILLGNAANQFLDDCVNQTEESPASYDISIQKAFRADVLAYCTTPQIDLKYFNSAKEQFSHIQRTLEVLFSEPSYGFVAEKVMLEPSFICESLGLQGRMDLLQSDWKNLIELKSGKADGWNGALRPKSSHSLQMALYKEILYYNLGMARQDVHTYLFYSTYPKLYAERSAKGQIQKAIDLRNRIVANELRLKQGEGEALISALTPKDFNEKQDMSKLWRDYQLPQIASWLQPFHDATDTEKAYFYRFLAFTEKEQFLSKTGDAQIDSTRGFASVWTADLTSKQEGGNILVELRIERLEGEEGIDRIVLSVPTYDEGFLPNFRKGDIVLFYERNGQADNATNRQVFRGSIEEIDDQQLTIKLRYAQRNRQVFRKESRYAVEHDFMDGSYNTIYRGLYTFLTAPQERKDLLLAVRPPRRDTTRTLARHYLNPQIDDIVLQAKQAKDYYLLVGPPGTGKTSVALKSMVEEFHAQADCQILLLSYTNRAVDEICEMLESIDYHPDYLRIGSELSCEARFRPHLIQNFTDRYASRRDIIAALNDIRIFVGTTASISGKPELFQLKHFQVAIVDEASQILEPQLMGILAGHSGNGVCAIDKFILVGDPKQLPAVVQQSPKDSAVSDPLLLDIGLTDCRNSLFERIYRWLHAHPQEGILGMLNRQGRMHPVVNDFSNHCFYDGVLDIVPVKHQTEELEFSVCPDAEHPMLPSPFGVGYSPYVQLLSTTRVGFLPSPPPPMEDSNKINRHEASIIAQLVKGIYELCALNGLPVNPAKRIGIIVPFRNQIALIGKALRELQLPQAEEITIDTVERYQGSQRDIILYSTTISQPYQLDILSVTTTDNGALIDRKLNVALTRAKKQMFMVGNERILRRSPLYQQFIEQYKITNI